MKKQLLAVALSGAMVFGGCTGAFADDVENMDSELITEELDMIPGSSDEDGGILDALLGTVLDKVGGNVSSLATGLLESLVFDEGYSGLIRILNDVDVSSILTNEEGEFELNEETLNRISKVLGDATGIDLSGAELSGLARMFQNPEQVAALAGGLFEEEQIGDIFLDHLRTYSTSLDSILDTVEDGEGGYDVVMIMNVLDSCKEVDNSIIIDGKEVTEEELTNAITATLKDLEANT